MKNPVFKIAILIVLLSMLLTLPLYSVEQPPVLRRFAFLIGADNGGGNRAVLEYAATDAQSLAKVLYEMGGLEDSDTIVLDNPGVEDVRWGFRKLKSNLALSKPDVRRTEFIFYYSGHSDENGLLLKGEQLSYQELKDSIQDLDADVHIAILDSCSSGAFTRLKGGQRKSPFMLDESVDTRGHAFLTSSSEDEAAQESDSIEASFFTYFLIAALRGAADSTMDGKVTLNEAYSYASEETLARTEQTLAGAQHASYDIQLTGSGELVLTDLRTASAKLELESDIAGRLYIRDIQGRLVAELRKLYGVPLSFGLPSGAYTVSLQGNDGLKEASLIIGDGRKAVLTSADFTSKQREATRSRGESEEPELVHVYNSIYLIPDFPTSDHYRLIHHLSLGLIGLSYRVDGFQAGLLNFVTEDVRGGQAAAIFNISGGNVTGGQGAGVFNINGGNAAFFQGAGVFNINSENFSGFQGAGVFNINDGWVAGFQGAGVFNIAAGDVSGAQGAGILNISSGELKGAQVSGIFNIADGNMSGFQGAGIFNISGGGLTKGAQLSGIFNAAEDVKGAQLSLVNIAEDLGGVQLGLVNIGEEIKGSQIGLVNINEEIHGIPVGLVNISQTGLYHIQGWYDEFGYTYVALQAGTRNLYTILYAGVPYESPESSLSAGVGAGMNFRLGNMFIEGDLSAKRYSFEENLSDSVMDILGCTRIDNIIPTARAVFGFKIFEFLSLFGGVSIHGRIENLTEDSFVFEGTPWKVLSNDDYLESDIILYEPVWTFGVRI